jgi:hypothetical protein
MVIDQRNAGAVVTPLNGAYTLDRWQSTASAASKYSFQQVTTAPVGFGNSMKLTSLSAYSVGAAESFRIQQPIEGYNIVDLAWGTANAKTVTLSFQVYSSLTGTFGGAITDSATAYSYPFSYTISSANTWTQISVTIAGPTSGTWGSTNGVGLYVIFSLGSGASVSTTAGAWAAGFYASVTGAVSVVGTNGATLYITGVQLEKGSTATSFDYRPYGTELALCQRYFTTFLGNSVYSRAGFGVGNSTTSASIGFVQPVAMRTGPTIAYSGNIALFNGSIIAVTSFAPDYADAIYSTVIANVASGVVTGNAYQILSSNNTTARITLSSEL